MAWGEVGVKSGTEGVSKVELGIKLGLELKLELGQLGLG